MSRPDQKQARRYPRIRLPEGMWIAWQAGGQQKVTRVATVGLGGLFISTPTPPPVGTIVKLLFDVPGGQVRARAVVRSSHHGEGMGVEFTQMDFEDRGRLRLLLKRLLG